MVEKYINIKSVENLEAELFKPNFIKDFSIELLTLIKNKKGNSLTHN